MLDCDLISYAKQATRFTNLHIEMGRARLTLPAWEEHLKVTVLPEYREAFCEPFEGISVVNLKSAATSLRDYYEELTATKELTTNEGDTEQWTNALIGRY